MKARKTVIHALIVIGCIVGLSVGIPVIACEDGGTEISDPGPLPSRGSPQGGTAAATALARPLSEFGLGLLLRQAESTPGNVVLSPVSLACVLSEIRDGAKGQTKRELTQALGFEGLSDAAIDQGWADLITAAQSGKYAGVTICNSLWLRDGIPFRERFLATNREYYAADCLPLSEDDDVSVRRINRWVSERTRGKIPKLFDQLDEGTILVVVNTVNLKVGWDLFQEEETTQAGFTLADGTRKNVMMMQGTLASEPAATLALESSEFDAVCLPTDGPVDVWLAVPKDEQTPEDIVRILAGQGGIAMLYDSASKHREVYVELPRFAFSYDTLGGDLKRDLNAMGIRRLFDPEADLGGIAAVPKPFYCTGIVHKARIQVDEKGVAAQAATGTQGCTGMGPLRVCADRPFLVILAASRSRAPLFLALVRDPQ